MKLSHASSLESMSALLSTTFRTACCTCFRAVNPAVNRAVNRAVFCAVFSAVGGMAISCHAAEASAADNEAAEWVSKMGHAIKHENYEGIFTYMRGSTYETVRIAHRFADGIEHESLLNLNGEVREMRRHDDEVTCHHPSQGNDPHQKFQHPAVHVGPFSSIFADRVTAAGHLYVTSMHGEDRIAGRPVVKLAVSPPHNDRYGYRLWLDKATGLLLQSHLIERGRVKEIFQFTSISFNEIEDKALEAIKGETLSHPLAIIEPPAMKEKPAWRVSWLPDGFRPVRMQGNRLHFTDGVATMSVFVENNQVSHPEIATRIGGTVVISRKFRKAGPQITVVGEVPVQTAKRLAESVEPVLY